MSFHSNYKELKEEGYTNKQIASFMGISIRSFYYYKKNAYEPKYTKPRMKKTFIRVIRYEKDQAEKQRIKRVKYEKKEKIKWEKEEAIRQKKYEEKELLKELPYVEKIEKEPVLHGFDSENVKREIKHYPPEYEVLYCLMYEFTIVHKDAKEELKREWTGLRRNPDNCIIEMERVLGSISASVDVYLTHTEWQYEAQLLISAY